MYYMYIPVDIEKWGTAEGSLRSGYLQYYLMINLNNQKNDLAILKDTAG